MGDPIKKFDTWLGKNIWVVFVCIIVGVVLWLKTDNGYWLFLAGAPFVILAILESNASNDPNYNDDEEGID